MRVGIHGLVTGITLFGLLAVSLIYPSQAQAYTCPGKLGVSRTVTLSTDGGARFGSSHGGHKKFLRAGEVVLTFDDGPVPGTTSKILHELSKHCAKATFFMVGGMARNHPGLVKKVLSAGHTIGAHGESHRNLGSTNAKTAIEDVDRSIRTINKAAGGKVAPFFRFPYLAENRAVNAYLNKRDYGVFAIDVDSLDYRFSDPDSMVNRVMHELDRKGRGIILMHDIQKVTANGIATLLDRLKSGGYKLVHTRGEGGREISGPLVMASLTRDLEHTPLRKNRVRTSAIKRKTDTVEGMAEPGIRKTESKHNVILITSNQRAVIKHRQLAILSTANQPGRLFREALKKRLILQ